MKECYKTMLEPYIDTISDFPKEGVQFKDISPLLADPYKFEYLVEAFEKEIEKAVGNFTYSIVGLDARGFVLGAPVAFKSGTGFIMARKKGKLPGAVIGADYDLEYGSATIEVQKDRVRGKRIVIIDDVLATGGTLRATIDAVREAGGTVAGVVVLLEIKELKGREKLDDVEVISLLEY